MSKHTPACMNCFNSKTCRVTSLWKKIHKRRVEGCCMGILGLKLPAPYLYFKTLGISWVKNFACAKIWTRGLLTNSILIFPVTFPSFVFLSDRCLYHQIDAYIDMAKQIDSVPSVLHCQDECQKVGGCGVEWVKFIKWPNKWDKNHLFGQSALLEISSRRENHWSPWLWRSNFFFFGGGGVGAD